MSEDSELHPAVRAIKTVCRCNNVKYRTIERAIKQGACSIREVAAKTLATTGYCGGSCTPDIQVMIADIAGGARPPIPEVRPGEEDAWWLTPAPGGER
ncbi:MAG TPA: (2Fe-2S)-binding protein [Thermoanaerobaculia bacterium]|nr:(2Fe-2S)-binding protein [Thermoanaerobaculia bacterium]